MPYDDINRETKQLIIFSTINILGMLLVIFIAMSFITNVKIEGTLTVPPYTCITPAQPNTNGK